MVKDSDMNYRKNTSELHPEIKVGRAGQPVIAYIFDRR